MNLSTSDLVTLSEYAITSAKQAGHIIEERKNGPISVSKKAGGESLASQVVTEVDRLCQERILEKLEPTLKRFELGLLTEESPDDESRFKKDFFWCIDPLDGTLPFIESTSGYAVSIALVSRSGEPQIGVVYDPLEPTLYHATKGQGAFINSAQYHQATPSPGHLISSSSPLTLVGDRSLAQHARYSSIASALETIAEERGLNGLHSILHGGAAMNACWVLENAPACYFKFPKAQAGGGSLWDYAATACIFQEAGAIATDISGAPLDLNRLDSTFMNHRGILFATDSDLAKCIRALSQD